jgi:hydroxymethylbilane synthase
MPLIMMTIPLRLGTRESPLALAQTAIAGRRLGEVEPQLAAGDALVVVPIRTTGDAVRDRPLAEVGGKGLFTKELDEALLGGRIDLAVHSVKDLPTWLPEGVTLACVLVRGDPRDAFIARTAASPEALPEGAVVGTASLRRQAQLLQQRPDLTVVVLRGNVQTRLRKVAAGEVEATLLALAGLQRLGLERAARAVLATERMLPAVGQAAVGITCRSDDAPTRALLARAGDAAAMAEVEAERAMLAALDGSCRTPIAGLARSGADGRLELRGLVARPDGSRVLRSTRSGWVQEAERMGRDLGAELKARAGPGFFAP